MSEIKTIGYTWMALNTFKCSYRTPLHFKWLNSTYSVGLTYIIIWHSATLVLSPDAPERQSARMSEIKTVGLTWMALNILNVAIWHHCTLKG